MRGPRRKAYTSAARITLPEVPILASYPMGQYVILSDGMIYNSVKALMS